MLEPSILNPPELPVVPVLVFWLGVLVLLMFAFGFVSTVELELLFALSRLSTLPPLFLFLTLVNRCES